jgi:hypothetical protein
MSNPHNAAKPKSAARPNRPASGLVQKEVGLADRKQTMRRTDRARVCLATDRIIHFLRMPRRADLLIR